MIRAFICYSHSPGDTDFARRLFGALSGGGYALTPVMDKESLALGTSWPDSIPVVLDACQLVLFVRSRFSIHAVMCRRELDYAADRGLEIINLRIDGDATGFERTVAYLTIDFSKGDQAGLSDLRRGLRFRTTPLGRLQLLNHQLIHHRDKLRDPSRSDRVQREQAVARIEAEIAGLQQRLGGEEEPETIAADREAAPLLLDREAECARLRELLSAADPAIVQVTGPEGVGKTSVVRAAVARWAADEAPGGGGRHLPVSPRPPRYDAGTRRLLRPASPRRRRSVARHRVDYRSLAGPAGGHRHRLGGESARTGRDGPGRSSA
jgi:hypothetical protein